MTTTSSTTTSSATVPSPTTMHSSATAASLSGTASTNTASSAPVPGPLNLLASELGRLLNLRATWGYAVAIVAIMAGIPMLMWLGTRGAATEFGFEPTLPDVLLGSDFAVIVALILAAVGALVPEGFGGAVAHIGILLLWTVIGSAVGMLVPVTAVATGLPVAWILLVEVALGTVPIEFLNKLTEYLPWTASRQLLDMMDIGVSNVHAGLVLAAWSVAVIGGGIVVAARRDVK